MGWWKDQLGLVAKGGPFVGPHGGKWADAQHTVPWKSDKGVEPGSRAHTGAVEEHLREHFGVKVSLGHSGNQVTLHKIIVPKEKRSEGAGTAVMDTLHRYADQHGKTVALSPSSDFGGTKKRLQKFYKKFGYVDNKGRNKDYAISESMYREPK